MIVPVTIVTGYNSAQVEEMPLNGETEVLHWGFNEYQEKDPQHTVYVWFVKSKYGEIYFREKKVDFFTLETDVKKNAIERFRTVAFTMEYTICQLFDKPVQIDKDFYAKFDVKHD